ncbi:probable helicase MAGATAMA 3 [Pistacia vera]|uniref:probable helicase MAGATAMA 3 n=1 Tax=Pistacia vera TaxID=55513 RepID=UPI001262D82A|nr:probable helicase MAGATAMA 3 [Pistacia vera]
MNVGITRAKSSILVVGSASTLKHDEHWKNLVMSAEKRDNLFKVSKPYISIFSDENLESMKQKPKVEDRGAQPMDVDRQHDNETNALFSNPGDAERGQADDNDYGDGDGDAFDGGFDAD